MNRRHEGNLKDDRSNIFKGTQERRAVGNSHTTQRDEISDEKLKGKQRVRISVKKTTVTDDRWRRKKEDKLNNGFPFPSFHYETLISER